MFHMEVQHIPGKANVVADLLSRQPWIPESEDKRGNSIALMRDAVYAEKKQGGEIRTLFLTITESRQKGRDDQFIEACYDIAFNGEDPKQWDHAHPWRKPLLTLKNNLFIEDDRVKLLRPDGKAVIVVGEHFRPTILQWFHDSLLGGHAGRDQMMAQLEKRYWWPSMYNDVSKYVKSCDKCQKADNSKGGLWHTLTPFAIEEPWHTIHLDLAEMDESLDGYKYVLVVKCNSSAFTVTKALPDKKSATVLWELIQILLTVGLCFKIVVDKGGEFMAKDITQFCESVGIICEPTTQHAHHTNGAAERAVQQLRAFLKKNASVAGQWPRLLPYHDYNQNSRFPTKLAGYSPAELVMGRKFRNPLDFQVVQKAGMRTLPEWQKQLLEDRRKAMATASQSKIKMIEAHKKKRPKGASNEKIAIGDMVLYDIMDTSKGHKNRPKMEGPVKVVRVEQEGNRIYVDIEGEVKEFQSKHIKKYHKRTQSNEDKSVLPPLPSIEISVEEIQDENGDAHSEGDEGDNVNKSDMEVEPMDLEEHIMPEDHVWRLATFLIPTLVI